MLSIPKLILLILIIGGIWFLSRAIQRRGIAGIFRNTRAAAPPRAGEPKALDMEKCRICGDFVPPDARACGQARCPYPHN
jgi:hypothetical protein